MDNTTFSYNLDMTHVSRQTIYIINNNINTTDSFNFGWDLTKALVAPHTKKSLLKGILSKPLQQLILSFAGVVAAAEKPPPPDDNIQRRCKICLDKTHGDSHKEAKKSIRKEKSCCCKCNHPVCQKHVVSLCKNCSW